MAALAPVPVDVKKLTSGVTTNSGTMEASTSATQGELIIQNANGTYQLAINTSISNADVSGSGGIVLSPAAAGKTVDYVSSIGCEIDLGVTVTANEWYCVGSVAGSIVPMGDLASGQAVQYVGYGNKDQKLIWYPVKANETIA
jgi:hypothetical protein